MPGAHILAALCKAHVAEAPKWLCHAPRQQSCLLSVPVSGFQLYEGLCLCCAGLMYLRLPLNAATAGYNRSAALWIAMFAFTLMPSETAVSVWCQEKAVVGNCAPVEMFCIAWKLLHYL